MRLNQAPKNPEKLAMKVIRSTSPCPSPSFLKMCKEMCRTEYKNAKKVKIALTLSVPLIGKCKKYDPVHIQGTRYKLTKREIKKY